MLLVKIASVSLLLDFIFLSFMKYYFNSMIQKIQGSPLKLNIFATAVVYFIIIFKYIISYFYKILVYYMRFYLVQPHMVYLNLQIWLYLKDGLIRQL